MKWLDGLQPGSVPEDGSLGWTVATVVVVLAAVVVLAFVVPVLALVVDVAIVAVVTIVGVAVHVLLRRPWRVSARSDERERSWAVVGWRRSDRAVDAVADSLASGNAIGQVDPTRALGTWRS